MLTPDDTFQNRESNIFKFNWQTFIIKNQNCDIIKILINQNVGTGWMLSILKFANSSVDFKDTNCFRHFYIQINESFSPDTQILFCKITPNLTKLLRYILPVQGCKQLSFMHPPRMEHTGGEMKIESKNLINFLIHYFFSDLHQGIVKLGSTE